MTTGPLRILAISRQTEGANDYAFVRAFRRAGHFVKVVNPTEYVPYGWTSGVLRYAKRALYGPATAAFNAAVVAEAEALRPHLFFVFKGQMVSADTVSAVRAMGVVAINFYPDTGFTSYGPFLAKAVSRYDFIYTTKEFGLTDLAENYGMPRAAYLNHAYDPEVHAAVPLQDDDWQRMEADVVFVGAQSPKKEAYLAHLIAARPDLTYRIWGGHRWQLPEAPRVFFGGALSGFEYSKALRGGKIALALLYEGDKDAPQGDDVTARTFEIPAAGAFMLHERTEMAMALFHEDRECAFFGSADELVTKVDHYLARPDLRAAIAAAGQKRCESSHYSVDARVATIVDTTVRIAAERNISVPQPAATVPLGA
ncbi:MAG: glycosyltransferase [Pseudomonadota bacterium]